MATQAPVTQTQDVHQIMKEEYKKCAENPVYFFKRFGTIQHPLKGRLNFNLFTFQEKVLSQLMEFDYNIILKSRQMGISTLTAAYSLWLMLFNSDKNILVIATKQEVAKNLITKVRYMYQNLPSWLKIECTEDNKLNLKFVNGSQIKAVSSSKDSGRSEAVSMLVIDEAAFIDDVEEIWGSAQQTLATGGKAIVLSTPNGVGNWFHKQWIDSEAGHGFCFNTIRLHWSMHPERDKTWRDAQENILGKRLAAQECFSGNTRIYTNRGLSRIDELHIGDLVLTHTGKFKPVIKTMVKKSNDTYEMFSSLNRNKRLVTKNHPFYTMNNTWEPVQNINDAQLLRSFPNNIEYNTDIFTIDLYKNINVDFFKLLIDSDNNELIYINDRRFKTRHMRYVDVDYDFGYLIGLYIAEGSKDYKRTCLSFNHATELNAWPVKIKEIIKNKLGISNGIIRKTGNNSANLEISSVILSKLISLFVDGEDCYTKRLSKFAYDVSNKEFFKGILNGIFVGDGCLTSTANKTLSVTSIDAVYDIKYISNILGYTLNCVRNTEYLSRHTKHIISFLKTRHDIDTDRNITTILDNNSFDAYSKSYQTFYNIDEQYTNCKIFKCIDDTNEEINVYNIAVLDDNSYVTEHFIVHNCDADFTTSGNTVIDVEVLKWYRETYLMKPIEKRFVSFTNKADFWIWEYPNRNKSYIIVADVARGDSKDNSGFHVINIETLEQVAEFQGLISTKDFGDLLVNVGTEYGTAMLICENANIGWAAIQQILDRGYTNLYYTKQALKYVDPRKQMNNRMHAEDKKSVPGFSTTTLTRPLIIAKLEEYFRERSIIIRSSRLMDELDVFIYTGTGASAKAEAARGYNDDLVMSLAIGLWVRDTSLQLMSQNVELQKSMMNSFSVSRPLQNSSAVYTAGMLAPETAWMQRMGGKDLYDLTDLLPSELKRKNDDE